MKTNLELLLELRAFLKLTSTVEVDLDTIFASLEEKAHDREALLDLWNEMQYSCLHGMNVIPC